MASGILVQNNVSMVQSAPVLVRMKAQQTPIKNTGKSTKCVSLNCMEMNNEHILIFIFKLQRWYRYAKQCMHEYHFG